MKNAFTEIAKFERKEKRLPVEDDPTFGETLEASLKYKYAPLANFITEGVTFGFEPKDMMDTYDPSPDIPENLKPYASSLLMAKSPEHLSFKIRNLKKALKTNETLARSGIGAQLGAELFDGINYISIPFRMAKTGGQAFLKGGIATGTVVAGQEAIRYPLDPTANKEEVALNLGASFFLGGALKHATSIKSIRKINAIEDGKNAINDMKKALEADDVELDPNIAPSIFTDSWVYKAATTPMKRVMTNPNVPNSVKLRTLGIANDSGILLAANKEGKKIGNSVFQNAKLHEGTWVRTNDDLIKIWGQSTGKGVINPMDYMVKRGDYEDWLASVDKKAMRGEQPANNFEAQAIQKLNKFYDDWEVQLRDQGLIGSQGDYTKVIRSRQNRLDLLEKRLKATKNPEYATTLTGQINRITRELDEAKANLADLEGMGAIKPPNEEIFRPRYFDMGKIRKNRDQFEKILSDWFAKNPEIWVKQSDGKFKKETLSSDPLAINKRVKAVVDGMINEPDPLNPDKMYYGMGKSKHFKHRALDIPNALVLDYMVTNPVSVMKAYTKRTAARLEFSKKHNGDSIDDILDDTFNEMMDEGIDINTIRSVQKDQRHLYDRVVGTVLRNPDARNQTIAKIMRDLAQLNYLGSAGLATITEPAKIIMEHGLGPTMRGLFTVLKNNQLKLGAKEGRIAGEILEIQNGSSQMRMVDDINNNPLNVEKMDKVKDAFYLLNGLSVITRALKDFDSMVRCHTLIDYSVRWAEGVDNPKGSIRATKMEQEYLLRYNIDLDDARRIAKSPWEKGESGLYLANTEAWANTIEFPTTKADIISGPTNAYAKDGRYRPAFYKERNGVGTIHIDEEYIKNVMYDQRGWENPRVEGVRPLETGLINSPEDYVTFIKMHEIMHSNFSAKDLGFLKTATILREVPNEKKVVGYRRKENIDTSGTYFVHYTRKQNIESLLRNGYDVNKKSIFPLATGEKLAGDVMYFTNDINRWKQGDIKVKEGTGNIDDINYDYNKQEWVTKKKGLKKETLEPVGAYLAKDAKLLVIDSWEKYQKIASELKVTGGMSELTKLANKKYDAIHLLNKKDGGWDVPLEKQKKDKYGDTITNYYDEVSLNSGNSDFFVFNKNKVEFEKEVFEETTVEYNTVKESREEIDLAGYENAINDLAAANIKNQNRTSDETVQTFRNALGSGIMNTILMGTPADKPIITDGIVYIPMRVAGKFGMKEDSAYKGYARIENGLLGLPFQFYSYSLAAVNKTMGAYAHGQFKNQYIGTAIAMGLGYMALQAKTPDWVELSFQDQFARSLDYSGIMPLYSDMFYTAMITTLAMDGPNITGGALQPKFPQEADTYDAVSGVMGAGPSITTDLSRAIYEIATGDVGEGSKDFIRNLPYARLWFLKGKVNELTNMLEGELDGPRGFGRF